MSRIDDLIAELCPGGVPFRKLSSLAKVKRGSKPDRLESTSDVVRVPVAGAGRSFLGWTDVANSPAGSITISSHGYPGFVTFWSEEFWQGNNVFLLSELDGRIIPRFLYFVLKGDEKRINSLSSVGGVPYLNASTLLAWRVPVPPLEVQWEIVRVLDQFTQLEAELEAELEARRRQYDFYRERLLFSSNQGRVELLGDIAAIGTGSHDTKDAVPFGEYPFFARGREPLALDEFDFEEAAIITAGDGVGVGRVFHFVEGKYALHQRAYRIVPHGSVHARYLYHYLVCDFARYLVRTSVHASVTSLRRPMFLNYPVRIPPPGEQRRVADSLDKFEALTMDLSTGLPAELAARRKQYEYYRDKLLTFERAA